MSHSIEETEHPTNSFRKNIAIVAGLIVLFIICVSTAAPKIKNYHFVNPFSHSSSSAQNFTHDGNNDTNLTKLRELMDNQSSFIYGVPQDLECSWVNDQQLIKEESLLPKEEGTPQSERTCVYLGTGKKSTGTDLSSTESGKSYVFRAVQYASEDEAKNAVSSLNANDYVREGVNVIVLTTKSGAQDGLVNEINRRISAK